jgi:hypothetical protein
MGSTTAPALKGHDDVGTMVAQFGWRHMFAACGIATAVAAIALSVSGLPRALISSKLVRLRTDSRILGMIRRHIIRLLMLSIRFHDKTEMGGRDSGQH